MFFFFTIIKQHKNNYNIQREDIISEWEYNISDAHLVGLCHQKECKDEEGNIMQGKPLSAVGTGRFRGAAYGVTQSNTTEAT